MKRILVLSAIIALVFGSCQNKNAAAKVEGNTKIYGVFKGGQGKVIIAGRLVNNRFQELAKDSLESENFALGFDLKLPELIYLQVSPDMTNTALFVEPNDEVEVEINGDIQNLKVLKGSKSTKSFAQLLQLVNEYRQKEKKLELEFQEATRQGKKDEVSRLRNEYYKLQDEKKAKLYALAEQNTDNITSAFILQMLSSDPDADFMRLKKIYESLSDDVKKSTYAQAAWNNIKNNMITAIGQKAPDFKAPTPEGDTLRMSNVLKKSKVLVIDFWASWCRPCRAENPYVVEIYKKYHDKGLNILGVSLDRPDARDKWLKAIKDDQLDWYHVSYLQYWQDPVARQYGIRSIPATLILDKNGVIRAKNLRREKLENKIKELLNE